MTTTAAGTILAIDLGKYKCVGRVCRCVTPDGEKGVPAEGTSLNEPRPEGSSAAQLATFEIGTSV
jgi:hypothetical protein